MLITALLLNIFEETNMVCDTFFFFQDSLMNRKFKRTAFIEIELFCNIINVYTVTFDKLNASLLKKCINFHGW